MHTILDRGAQADELDPITKDLADFTQTARGEVRAWDQVGSEQVGQGRRIDAIGLDPGRGDGPRLQWVSKHDLSSVVLERVSEHWPDPASLEHHLGRFDALSQQASQALGVVSDPTLAEQRAPFVKPREDRVPLVNIQPEVLHDHLPRADLRTPRVPPLSCRWLSWHHLSELRSSSPLPRDRRAAEGDSRVVRGSRLSELHETVSFNLAAQVGNSFVGDHHQGVCTKHGPAPSAARIAATGHSPAAPTASGRRPQTPRGFPRRPEWPQG